MFEQYISNLKDVEQQNAICVLPGHDDKNASLSINRKKMRFYCHGCNQMGDIYQFVMLMENCDFKTAKYKIIGDVRKSVLSEAEVVEAHKYLMNKKYLQDMLYSHRLWTIDTIIKFKLGWVEREKRVQIPIYNHNGELINIRKYLLGTKPTKKNPKFRGVRGHNENYFFPIQNLIKNDFIMIMAGEPDTILACQLKYNAGTFTAGEGKFNRNLLPYFKDKLVYICYDKDVPGFKALKMIGPEIAKYAKTVKIINLPFGG